MNSDIKPDFRKTATLYFKDEASIKAGILLQSGIWTDHVEPLLSTVKRLQEEKKELVEALKNLANANPNDSSWNYPAAFTKAIQLLKQLES